MEPVPDARHKADRRLQYGVRKRANTGPGHYVQSIPVSLSCTYPVPGRSRSMTGVVT